MESVELLAVGVEADDAAGGAGEGGAQLRVVLALGGLQGAEDAVAGDEEVRGLLAEQVALQRGAHVLVAPEGEHHALLDAAVEDDRAVGLDPLDGADVDLAVADEGEGVHEGHLVGHLGGEQAEGAGVGLQGGVAVHLVDAAAGHVGPGDDEGAGGRRVVLVLDDLEGGLRLGHHEDTRAGEGLPAVEDVGAAEGQVVAGAPAEERQPFEGVGHQRHGVLLLAGEAVEEGEAEVAAGVRVLPGEAQRGEQPVRDRTCLRLVQPVKITDDPGRPANLRRADRRENDAAGGVLSVEDLPGGGAPGHGGPGEARRQRGGQRRRVLPGRGEDQHQIRGEVAEALGRLGDRRDRVFAARSSLEYPHDPSCFIHRNPRNVRSS